jgi:hypothetical protein
MSQNQTLEEALRRHMVSLPLPSLNLSFEDPEFVEASERWGCSQMQDGLVVPGLPLEEQPPSPPFAKNLTDYERSIVASMAKAPCQPPWLRGRRRCLVCCDLNFQRGRGQGEEDEFPAGEKAACFAHIRELALAVRSGCLSCRFLWTVIFSMLKLNPRPRCFSMNDPLSIAGVRLESAVEGGPLTIQWTNCFAVRVGYELNDPRRRIELYTGGT